MHIKTISVYGCGGTGSHVLHGLARIDYMMSMWNKQKRFHVSAYDPDVVEHGNIGRQSFFPSDVDQNKAEVLCRRINTFYHTRWRAYPNKAPSSDKVDLVISCVDTVKSREAIAKSWQTKGTYMIDCGNSRTSGQILIGQFKGELPNLYQEHEDLIYGDEPEDEPGCVDPELRQSLFTNSTIAQLACNYVWNIVRWNKIQNRGIFLDIDKGVANSIKIDKDKP